MNAIKSFVDWLKSRSLENEVEARLKQLGEEAVAEFDGFKAAIEARVEALEARFTKPETVSIPQTPEPPTPPTTEPGTTASPPKDPSIESSAPAPTPPSEGAGPVPAVS